MKQNDSFRAKQPPIRRRTNSKASQPKSVKSGTLVDFFRRSPLAGSGLVLERKPDYGRKIDLNE
jgi:hypothetical protein